MDKNTKISLRVNIAERLMLLKHFGESYSDVIERLLNVKSMKKQK